MKVYIKFLTYNFLKSFFYVIGIMFSLVLILNVLTELEFLKELGKYKFYLTCYS